MSVLVLLLLVAASGLFGWGVVRRFSRLAGDWLERLMASLIIGIVSLGTIALFLAEIGRFSILILTITYVFLLLPLLIWPRQSPTPNPQSPTTNLQYLLLLLWLPAALWLFFRPHEYILGAADAGVYVNLGASIAETGAILIENDFLPTLPAELQTAVLRPVTYADADAYYLPAFYVADLAQPNQITPQFYPTHPVWLAIGHGLTRVLGGTVETAVWTELYLPGLWALLSVVAVYLTVRQFAGWPTAMLALAGLTLNGLQIWFARYPVTETFAQFLLWAGLWAVGGWLSGREDNRLWALIGGLALGQSFLLRIDAVFMLPVLGLLWLWLWANGRWQASYTWFFVPLVAQIVYSIVHAVWQSAPYFFELFGFGLILLQVYWGLPVAGIVIGVILLVTIGRYRGQFGQLAWLKRPFLLTLIILIAVATVYLWFIRPNLGGDIFIYDDPYSESGVPWYDHENLIRLGWYLSPVTIWLGVAGIALMVWRVERKTVILLAICGFFTAFYLWNIRSNPVQIYTMRRYLAATVPLFVVGTAVFLGWVAQLKTAKQWISWQEWHDGLLLTAPLALIWLGSLGLAARGFISQIDLNGFIDQVAAFDQQLAPNAILIFNQQAPISSGDNLGTPLHFLYGHDILTLRDWDAFESEQLADTIQQWRENGRSVYWAGDPSWLTAQNIPFTPGEMDIQNSWLELVYEHKPQQIIPIHWQFPFATLHPLGHATSNQEVSSSP
ncbi:MAG: hypothetical protein AAF614_10640 [Chloroflexota bacterium]